MRLALLIWTGIVVVNIINASAPLEAVHHATAGFVDGMLAAVVLNEWAKKKGVRP